MLDLNLTDDEVLALDDAIQLREPIEGMPLWSALDKIRTVAAKIREERRKDAKSRV